MGSVMGDELIQAYKLAWEALLAVFGIVLVLVLVLEKARQQIRCVAIRDSVRRASFFVVGVCPRNGLGTVFEHEHEHEKISVRSFLGGYGDVGATANAQERSVHERLWGSVVPSEFRRLAFGT